MRRIYSTPIQTCGTRWEAAAIYNTRKPRLSRKQTNETKLQSVPVHMTPAEITREVERLQQENAKLRAISEEHEAEQRAIRVARSQERLDALKALG